jgi:hypothetical protein
MRAVGEAILRLAEEERAALYLAPEATVPRFQRIAPLKTVDERVAALRAILGGGEAAPGPRGAPRAAATFRAGPARGGDGWSVRVSYRDGDVARDPELAARLERFLEEQLERLRQQLRTARGGEIAPRAPVTWEIE